MFDLDQLIYTSQVNDSYDVVAADEINRRIAAEWGTPEDVRYWAVDIGLAAKLLEYETHICLLPHIKGGWIAVNISEYYEGEMRVIRCKTLARTMCAAFLEWVHLGRK